MQKKWSTAPTRQMNVAWWVMLVFLLLPGQADASGIALNRFGGIFGHSNTEGGLAMFWNPARISRRGGGFVTVDATLVSRNASYDRRIYEDERERPDQVGNPYYNDPGVLETNVGEATTSTLAVMPYLAGGYTFELPRVHYGFGLAVHPAYGGSATWDKNLSAPSEYPGGVDGPQRWSAVSSRFLILHSTLAGSATFPDLGLSFGVALTLAGGDIATVRARNINRGEQPLDENGFIQEGRIFFEGRDTALSLSLGASLDRGPVTVSAHYRSGYNLNIRGDLRQAYATQPLIQVRAFLDFPTPHVLNSALTVRAGDLSITGIVDYSVWSRMQSNIIFVETDPPDQLLEIPRNLRNTVSLRGLVGYTFLEHFEAALSFGYDPSAVPANSLDAALADANKFQAGAGIRGLFNERWSVMLSYSHDFYQTVEVTRSIQEPTTNGTYRDQRRWLNLSLEARL